MSTQEDYTEEVLTRAGSRKLNGLARGDSVKRLPQLGRLENREKDSNAGNLQPSTPYEKLQSWMINEGKYYQERWDVMVRSSRHARAM